MRILLLGPLPPESGGVSSHVRDLAAALSMAGHEVTVLARAFPGEGEAESDRLLRRVRIERIPDHGLSRLLWVPAIARHLRRHDIAHAHTFRLGYLATHLRNRTPLVLTVHGYMARELAALEEGIPRSRRRLYEYVERTTLSAADSLIAVDGGRASWARKYAKSDVTVLPSGLLPDDYPSFVPRNQRTGLVCVRHLYPFYGVAYAIRAMALLPSDCHLVVAGDGPLRAQLETLVRELEVETRVNLLGRIPRLDAIRRMSRASAALVPSVPVAGVEEAPCIAALEAMAVGTPVIASSVGGLQEIIRDGENGLLVPPKDVEAIAGCVDRLTVDGALWDRISRNGRRYVEEYHSWPRLVRKVEAVYEGLLFRR